MLSSAKHAGAYKCHRADKKKQGYITSTYERKQHVKVMSEQQNAHHWNKIVNAKML